MAKLIKKVVRCRHDHNGVTMLHGEHERPPAAFRIGSSEVCLDCGQELPRGWDKVHVPKQQLSSLEARAGLSSTVAEA
jgi:hypothetical protein